MLWLPERSILLVAHGDGPQTCICLCLSTCNSHRPYYIAQFSPHSWRSLKLPDTDSTDVHCKCKCYTCNLDVETHISTYLQGLHLDAGSRTVADAPPLLSCGRQKLLEGRSMWLQHLQCASLISTSTITSYMLQAVPTRPLKSMELYAALDGFLHAASWQVSLPCQALPPFAWCVLHSRWLPATAQPASASPQTAPTRQHQAL